MKKPITLVLACAILLPFSVYAYRTSSAQELRELRGKVEQLEGEKDGYARDLDQRTTQVKAVRYLLGEKLPEQAPIIDATFDAVLVSDETIPNDAAASNVEGE